MVQLKIKDNQCIPKYSFTEIQEIVNHVADKTLGQLEKEEVFVFPEKIRETEDLDKDQMILQSVNDSFFTGNVMGFIGVGESQLIIESRFSTNEEDYFFQYLLERVLDFPNFINLNTEANQQNPMMNLLLFLFPKYLQQAMRKGLYKTYIRREYNDENIRGTIDVALHIRQNVPFTGNVAYHQREHSYDNDLMELIRHTIEFIKRKPYGSKLLHSVKDEIKLVEDATPHYKVTDRRKILQNNQKNVVQHAFYHEYRALQKLCVMILKNENQQYGLGKRKVYGILFDGAWLWEEYVNQLIGDQFYHPKNKAKEGAQRLFNGNCIGLIFPDFIGKNPNERIIADAKYKPQGNIGGKDYLQLLAYMYRFDSKSGFYLYPEADSQSCVHLKLNKGSTYENNVAPRDDIQIVKLGLKIPDDAATYKEFVLKMQNAESEYCKQILI